MTHIPDHGTMISLSRALPQPSDRRDGERYLTLLRVGSATVDGRRHLCLIRNVSCGGMLIRTYSELEPGARLSIEFRHGESVVGTVRWAKDGDVGLMFDHAIDVLQLLESAISGPRPRMPRVQLSTACWIRCGTVTQRSEAIDISQGGMQVRIPRPLSLRDEVLVTIPGLPVMAGVVSWTDGQSFGVSFNQVMPLQTLIRWLKSRPEGDQLLAAS